MTFILIINKIIWNISKIIICSIKKCIFHVIYLNSFLHFLKSVLISSSDILNYMEIKLILNLKWNRLLQYHRIHQCLINRMKIVIVKMILKWINRNLVTIRLYNLILRRWIFYIKKIDSLQWSSLKCIWISIMMNLMFMIVTLIYYVNLLSSVKSQLDIGLYKSIVLIVESQTIIV